MRAQRLVVALVAVLAAGAATAQTDTPTVTATATVTPTITPTLTADRALALAATCASTPCSYADTAGLYLQKGHGNTTTIAVRTTAGTATVVPYCRISTGFTPVEFALGSLTGATCSTGSNCALTTTAVCDEIFLSITACGSTCRVNSWLRIDPD